MVIGRLAVNDGPLQILCQEYKYVEKNVHSSPGSFDNSCEWLQKARISKSLIL